MSEHFTIVCSECRKQITTCRCMSPNKTIRFALCDLCQKKPYTPLLPFEGVEWRPTERDYWDLSSPLRPL